MNNFCNICQKKVYQFGNSQKYVANQKINWEHDSIFKLLKLDTAQVYFTFCPSCINFRLMPEFPNKILYLEDGYSIRKKIFETYFPSEKYNDFLKKNNKNHEFKISSELERLAKYSNVVAKEYFHSKTCQKNKSIKILDYGGGDGYMSKSIKAILEALFDINVINDVFNPSQNEKKEISEKVEKKYDIIILSHVLEHVHFLDEFLKEVQFFSDEQTKIIVEVPDERFKLFKVLFRIRKNFMEAHVNFFSKFSLLKLFSKFQYYGKVSYITTAWRGQKMMTIFGVFRLTKARNNYRIYEIFHLFTYFFRGIYYKMTK